MERFTANDIEVFKLNGAKQLLGVFTALHEEMDSVSEFKMKFKNTINIHKNRPTNTLFTLNSLNRVIAQQNGKPDPNFRVDWSGFKDCVVLVKGSDLVSFPLEKAKS